MACRRRSLIVSCVLLGLLPGCFLKGAPEPVPVTAEQQVFYSDDSHWPEEAAVVIRDAEDWSLWWERLTGSSENRPRVDFDSSMLLLFNAGKRYPGDRIQIEELVPGDGALVARYRLDESGVQGSEVYPVQVVRVRRRSDPIRFERVSS